ncbi:aminotransferase class I/II-fold pyridoxal phosphate-dependent enzyme [Marininema halotolerans]|uniref:Cystathionine beta-lyase family protein involved in aluminum resistance n=1 Tax=Marininema halotolerans TaxID=1155944 RepID=A0A1I6R6Y0_9BACL|nr:methionine gamma-lyase family protein [Marininema halotolerans]SFS60424.1 Cystathionine beta-lyase family protein involved in aluminum resistance [Marininema halotolerans]
MYRFFQNEDVLQPWGEEAERKIAPILRRIERQVDEHQWRLLSAYRRAGVSEAHLAASTGYGYDDLGREALETIVAEVFGAETCLFRSHITSGTHAIAASLFGILRPGDELLYITGAPYDTLHQVIGQESDGSGSLADYGISYQAISLTSNGEVDWPAVQQAVTPRTRCIAIQRSRGYAERASFSIDQIEAMIAQARRISPQAAIFVDNCYGEFVEDREPTHVGADLIAGSLIKNPGGGLAKSGGYIAGKKNWVDRAASRLVAPGILAEGGASHGYLRDFYQGFFLAPHVVGEALKGAVYAAAMLEAAGFLSTPRWEDPRTDIIQLIQFGRPEPLIDFCQGIQAASPVDAHVRPEPSQMPGYEDPVIMAAGTFVQGASIELSADGPLRSPYRAYMQGGLTYSHVKIGILTALDRVVERRKSLSGSHSYEA